MVKDQPLKRSAQPTFNLPSRITSTFTANEICIRELEAKVSTLLADDTVQVEVDKIMSDDMTAIVKAAQDEDKIDNFYSIFWKEQQKLNSMKRNGERYHPELIKNVYCTAPGIQDNVLEELKSKSLSLASHERFLVISIDEMKVKENIVYNAATDRIIGFVDLGVDRQYNNEAPATHALQFYGRSILSNFSRPIVFYATKNTKAFHLVSMFWEVVESLAGCGFTVLALVADGASCNRKLFQLLNNSNLTVPYKCINIYQPEMPIYLISDPPHLLKTACNCVRSSRPGGARMMKYNQHFILWKHFCHVPYLFESSELRSCKLTDGHFSHKSYAKMRVCYAAQLLSGTVSSLMKSRGGEEMKMSAWFAGLMNKMNLMNSSSRVNLCNVKCFPFLLCATVVTCDKNTSNNFRVKHSDNFLGKKNSDGMHVIPSQENL
ncbi:uncharacterized protein LOC143447005 isoform X2 [Clavelina lepadiformis]